MRFDQKTVLITGGSSGIGLSLAKEIAKTAEKVVITGRNEEKIKKVVEENPQFDYVVADVADQDAIAGLAQKMVDDYGGVDILINNAGIFNNVDYANGQLSVNEQLNEINIDFSAPIVMVNYFLPQLKTKKEAAIVNVSSGLAFVALTEAPVYCATKAGLHSWTLSLRYQLKKTPIKVFELMPPLVKTPMVTRYEGHPMMEPDKLAKAFVKGFNKDKLEITPGQSSQLRFMSRLAPKFILNAVNKQFS